MGSLTCTTDATPLQSASGTVYLSPTKRKRTPLKEKGRKDLHSPVPSSTNTNTSTLPLPSTVEIYKWVFTKDAIAPCFICDIRIMKKNQGEDFYWLKRVPCRTVKIVGMVVGTQTYEKRISYLVDDGTSVIDCVHKCSPAPQPQPQQHPSSTTTKGHGMTTTMKTQTEDPISPKPIAWIGDTVQVTGRVDDLRWKDSQGQRQILVQDIVRCKSINEKLYHWRTVLDLHDNKYSLAEPFTIPISAPPPSTTTNPMLISMPPPATTTPGMLSIPWTPSTPSKGWISSSSTPSSSTSSPSSMTSASPGSVSSSSAYTSTSTSTNSSPVKGKEVKLRDPSRLHTKDLTTVTFCLYVKYYINQLANSNSISRLGDPDSDTDLESDSDTSSESNSNSELESSDNDDAPAAGPLTPTKHRQRQRLRLSEYSKQEQETPRRIVDEATPRPMRRLPLPLSPSARPRPPNRPLNSSPSRSPSKSSSSKSQRKGFTLSYLRRVPTLAKLASRVVKAEGKRREREAKKRMKEERGKGGKSQSSAMSSSILSNSTSSSSSSAQTTAAQTKRLWRHTIIQLLQEGSIVLWDGPTYPLPSSSSLSSLSSFPAQADAFIDGFQAEYSMGTCMSNRSTSRSRSMAGWTPAAAGDFSTISTISSISSSCGQEEEEATLSDPKPNEEAYIALTPDLIAGEVEGVLRVLTQTQRSGYGHHQSSRSDTSRSSHSSHSASKSRILTYLQRDDRWRRVGAWDVDAALELLIERRRVCRVSRGGDGDERWRIL